MVLFLASALSFEQTVWALLGYRSIEAGVVVIDIQEVRSPKATSASASGVQFASTSYPLFLHLISQEFPAGPTSYPRISNHQD